MRHSEYDVLLFDLDGTVVDYADTEEAALIEVHRTFFGGRPGFEQFRRAFRCHNDRLWAEYRQQQVDLGYLRVERFARVARLFGATAAAPQIAAGFEHNLGRNVALFPEARRALQALRRGFRMVLVTDGIASVQREKLRRSRLGELFDRVVISSEVGHRKPEAALIRAALAAAGAAPRTALMVGDSQVSDGIGAQRAGVDFCWVNRGAPHSRDGVPVRYEIDSLRALPPLLAPLPGTSP